MPEETIKIVRVLVVSQEATIVSQLCSLGAKNSWDIENATDGWAAIERLEAGAVPDLLMLEAPQRDPGGLHFLRWARRLRPQLPILLICDPGDPSTRKEAVRLGARDCLVTPAEDRVVEMMITHHIPVLDAMQRGITSDDVERLDDDEFFIGASIVMRKLRAQAQLLAATDAPVLILGESGSGKRRTAQLIHQLSIRSGFEFAVINCAALPCDLLENELFGNSQNGSGSAFSRLGKLKLCEKGTILLDEITEMPASLQVKLVQVLQNKRFSDSGNTVPVQVDVRILAASTASAERAVANRKLREDLYYKLSAYTIQVPPLRERREEIPLLLHYFMRHFSRHYAIAARTFSPAVLEACQSHAWPGNLRELETFVKRYLLAGEVDLQAEVGKLPCEDAWQLSTATKTRSSATQWSVAPDSESLKALVRTARLETERNAIAEALKATGWNRKAAARLLKVSYRTLLYKVDQYRLKSPDSSLTTTRIWRRGERDEFGSAD